GQRDHHVAQLPQMLEIAPRELVALFSRDFLERGHLDNFADRPLSIRAIENELLKFRAAKLIRASNEKTGGLSRQPRRMMQNEASPIARFEIDSGHVGAGVPNCKAM